MFPGCFFSASHCSFISIILTLVPEVKKFGEGGGKICSSSAIVLGEESVKISPVAAQGGCVKWRGAHPSDVSVQAVELVVLETLEPGLFSLQVPQHPGPDALELVGVFGREDLQALPHRRT